VLEGTLRPRLGDRTIKAGAGSLPASPRGVVHTFRNDGDGAVRLLDFNTPAGV
jgi:quercetin dioxygenase-like cupin family protein